MSADYHTEHFNGYQHEGYVDIFAINVDDGSESNIGWFTKGMAEEIMSMFDEPTDELDSSGAPEQYQNEPGD